MASLVSGSFATISEEGRLRLSEETVIFKEKQLKDTRSSNTHIFEFLRRMLQSAVLSDGEALSCLQGYYFTRI